MVRFSSDFINLVNICWRKCITSTTEMPRFATTIIAGYLYKSATLGSVGVAYEDLFLLVIYMHCSNVARNTTSD